jgi:hypothetical protein
MSIPSKARPQSLLHVIWADEEIAVLRRLYPTAPWPEILRAFPNRSRSAINQFARMALGMKRVCSPRNKWTQDEIAHLKDLWPSAELSEIFAAFPLHGHRGIQQKAIALRLRRKTAAQRNPRFKAHPILLLLREEREGQHLTRLDVSKKTGYCVGQICNWENGKARPMWHHIVDYAEGLGLEIVLRKNLTDVTLASNVIPWPDKKKLMGSR